MEKFWVDCPQCNGIGSIGKGPYDIGPCNLCHGTGENSGKITWNHRRLFLAHLQLGEAIFDLSQEIRDSECIPILKDELKFYKKRCADLEQVLDRIRKGEN